VCAEIAWASMEEWREWVEREGWKEGEDERGELFLVGLRDWEMMRSGVWEFVEYVDEWKELTSGEEERWGEVKGGLNGAMTRLGDAGTMLKDEFSGGRGGERMVRPFLQASGEMLKMYRECFTFIGGLEEGFYGRWLVEHLGGVSKTWYDDE